MILQMERHKKWSKFMHTLIITIVTICYNVMSLKIIWIFPKEKNKNLNKLTEDL